MSRVDREQDDLLGTIPLVDGDGLLADRLFEQLVDLLVESMFLELREAYVAGRIDRGTYVQELSTLAEQCRRAGLLPLPSRDA